ncbi:carboxymuconolactone decarboxylase family protein [Streptomyces sp. ID05-04B]|uniref:carboxymuconolactone decarboxylase family protein n=1 Tax=unclassified Streptomyces TaxID=2593676 RepID=UPI000D1A7AF8|nr:MULTISPECIES: carboxymuconolactone decarboxylase family protein [unclassified Streptomyces]AVV45646.1 carboxymuconolactone decarboxylase family protein [Streptomyces sp. P3]MDX5562869.1 carboxymuconolactone decarboxylase family protein [Streptomyces sp. ID05-04B]
MTRVPPVPYEEWDTEVLRPLTGGRTVPPSNVLGLLLNHPELAKAFLTFGTHLLYRSTLPARTRELTILRVAWRHRCRYEWSHHVSLARAAGVTETELEEVRRGAPTLLNRAVDELETTSSLSDEVYGELAKDMDERRLMDFVFTVGAYGMQAMAYNTFGVEPDPGTDDGGTGGQGAAA